MAELMEEAFGESVQIESQIVIDRSGGNFGCEVLRMVIKTESEKEYFLIVKRMPEDEDTARMVLESGVMKREALMYARILKSFSIHIPLCYLARSDALILQDMYSVGYKTGSRITGMDFNQCRLALKQLAKFHAGSVIARCHDPEQFQQEMSNFPEPIYTEENREVMTHYMKTCLTNIAATLRGHEQLRYTAIAEEIEMLADTAYDAMIEAVTRYTKVLVLTHGDFWVGNLLFRYEDGKPVACCVIDFQVGRCGSPALDLIYFLCTSCTGETRRNHLQELLHLYLHEARLTLRNNNICIETSTDELKKHTEEVKPDGDELNLTGNSCQEPKDSNIIIDEANVPSLHQNPLGVVEIDSDELRNTDEIKVVESYPEEPDYQLVDEVGIDVVQTADELQCQFYTDVEQLRDELHELALFGLLAACLVLPPALQTGDEDSQYEGELFQTRFHELLDEFDDDGLFEQLRKQRL